MGYTKIMLLWRYRAQRARLVKNLLRYLFLFLSLTAFLFNPLHLLFVAAQSEDEFVSELVASMSVEEKVGQLFLVSFPGNNLSPTSDIAQLVQEYRIGGVVLQASNRNFFNTEDAPRQVLALTNGLQSLALTPPTPSVITSTPPITPTWNPLPLLIAIDHEGDGYPYTTLRSGMTSAPDNMALGATWNEENALTVGQVVGQELAAVGVNFLLGPSLDVLDRPRPSLAGDLGTRTFGGDPYWVGKLGRAYIAGVHKGSEGRVAVAAKHFPGLGGSDRRPDEEVATVQKSLEQLRQIELAPFFAVTQPATGTVTTAEALMTSHIRYRGFQGNIRQLTRPISFDAQNLPAILALPEIQPWRKSGGILLAGPLGVPAIKKFYDPSLQSFNAKRVAQEAFLAGNDLLILSQFGLTDSWDEQLGNIKSTIQFFREKYNADADFKARVDDAVWRIIRLKHSLYPDFSLASVQRPLEGLTRVGQGNSAMIQVAKSAVTLVYPGSGELADRLPSPPLGDENIVIFTDDRQARDCTDCPFFYFIEPLAIQTLMLQLYGPQASGQVDPARVNSFTFTQLKTALATATANEPLSVEINNLIGQTDWIIFAMLDINTTDYPQSDAVRLFLRTRSDSLRGKKIVVMAYNAPYYLDTTEISKLTAYYGVYGKTPEALEASIRVLFQEFNPVGAPPVSVEGINYDLIRQMEPDPNQVIGIEVVHETAVMTATKKPAPSPVPGETPTSTALGIKVGDTLHLRTTVIVDRNGHPVPDGTPVVFRLLYPTEGRELPRQSANTVNGVAETSVTLDHVGQLLITASSDPANRSVTMVVTIEAEKGAIIATVVPSPTATATSTPTPTPTPTPPTPTPTATVAPAAEEPPAKPLMAKLLNEFDLFLSFVSVALLGSAIYLAGGYGRRALRDRLRTFLWGLACGLLGYILYGVGWLSLRGLPWAGEALFQWVPQRLEPVLICLIFGLSPLPVLWWKGHRAYLEAGRAVDEDFTEEQGLRE
jgi:beta-N-acetylhexosaminidase